MCVCLCACVCSMFNVVSNGVQYIIVIRVVTTILSTNFGGGGWLCWVVCSDDVVVDVCRRNVLGLKWSPSVFVCLCTERPMRL